MTERQEIWRHLAILLVACLALFSPGLTSLPAIDRDESRYAQASRQMLASGDWVDIRFQDEARHKKPVGVYWLQAATAALIGEDPANPVWVYRLPSQMGALLAVLLTYAVGRALFTPGVALVGALALASSILLGVEARFAKTDAVQLAVLLAMQLGLARAYLAQRAGQPIRALDAALFWGGLGLGVLVKGPVAPLLAGLTALALGAADRKIMWVWRLHPLWGIPLAAAIAVPWLAAILIRSDGGFVAESLGHDWLGKVVAVQESHGAPPGTFLAVMPLTLFPASLLVLLGLPWIWRNRRLDSVRFLLASILPFWLVFEAIPTKLPHYVLPTYPALCLLAAAALAGGGWWRATSVRWAVVAVWAIYGLALAGVFVLLPGLVLSIAPDWLGWPAALCLVLIVVCGLTLVGDGVCTSTLSAAVVAMAALAVSAYALAFPRLDSLWVARAMAKAEAIRGIDSAAVAGFHEPSTVIWLGTDIQLTDGDNAAAAFADGRAVWVERAELASFTAALAAPPGPATAQIDGFNYSRGDPVHLFLYQPPPPASAEPSP